jgi:RNA polymerase sigma factor (sigma-70 family)
MATADQASAIVTELFETWYAPMLHFTARSIHNHQVAEEIVQDAFTELYKELRAGKRVDFPKAWVLRVIRRRVWREYQIPQPTNLDEVFATVPSAVEDHSELALLLNQVTPREAEAVLLRAAGLGYAEIAEELGIATGTVSALLARALRRMQQATRRTADPAFERDSMRRKGPK